jgi:uncharacterized protein (TIGR00251 family)
MVDPLLKITATPEGVIFFVRVQPRASSNAIAGVMDGALRIRLQDPAVDDRANAALCEYLAHLLKTSKSAVRILAGDRNRFKRIEVCGVTEKQVRGLLLHAA